MNIKHIIAIFLGLFLYGAGDLVEWIGLSHYWAVIAFLCLVWLLVIPFTAYIIYLYFVDRKEDNSIMVEHEGYTMSLKYWYDNFVDKQ